MSGRRFLHAFLPSSERQPNMPKVERMEKKIMLSKGHYLRYGRFGWRTGQLDKTYVCSEFTAAFHI